MSVTTPPRNQGDTIVALTRPRKLRSYSHAIPEVPGGAVVQESEFKIRLANTEGRRSETSYLIRRRYAWRGYRVSPLGESPANRITLAAFDGDASVATITVGIDSAAGLLVENLYPGEVRALRAEGRSLCEFTRLAVDNLVRSRVVLAAIFHIAYIYARRIRGSSDLLIEVNPRHVRFYEAMLGFEICGAERIDPRVNAPALLLRLALSHAEEQIAELGGNPKLAETLHSLYPLFFSAAEERGIEGRLRRMG